MKSIDWSHLHPKYSGKWVAFKKDEKTIITSAKSFSSAIKKSHKKGFKNPIMFKVPQEQVAYVGQV